MRKESLKTSKMNNQDKLVQKQLSMVQFADLSNYDEATKTYHIPKVNKIRIELNHSYIIRVKDSIKNNDLLRNNYNRGNEPELTTYLIDVIAVLNKVIKVNAVKYNIKENKVENTYWNGYLSVKDIEIIKEC